MAYNNLRNIHEIDFHNPSILVIGAGFIADQYCLALRRLGINQVTVVSRSETSAGRIREAHGFSAFPGGYAEKLPSLPVFDLVVVATPIHDLLSAARLALARGNGNLLIEKPGALYSSEIKAFQEESKDAPSRIRVAFNRLAYPNFWKLQELAREEGGITSCRYTFTEWVHTINFDKESQEAYRRWGISNSLHVISMAHALIGFPRELAAFQQGEFSWHPSGSRFSGAGLSDRDIPFSYHADWDSAGRWGVEIMTRQNAYQLIPLEGLFRCKKGTVQWEPVEFQKAFEDVKQGLAEEVAVMLKPELEETPILPDLKETARFLETAEKIFGYDNSW